MIYNLKHLSYILRCSKEEIIYVADHIDKYYYSFECNKKKYGYPQIDAKNGHPKTRKLDPCDGSLKKIQSRLDVFLQQKVAFPDYMYGAIKKKNNIQNALQHSHNKHFLSVDLKDFFPNITHRQVFKMFLSLGCPPDIAGLLTKLTTYKRRLAQGPSTSPVIANLVFMKTASRLRKIAEKNNLLFTNYLDDQSFSSRADFKAIIPEILDEIKQAGFVLNHKKISYKTHFPEVTGIFLHKGKLLLNPTIRNGARVNPNIYAYEKRVMNANISRKA